jgi:hypothetical protein
LHEGGGVIIHVTLDGAQSGSLNAMDSDDGVTKLLLWARKHHALLGEILTMGDLSTAHLTSIPKSDWPKYLYQANGEELPRTEFSRPEVVLSEIAL